MCTSLIVGKAASTTGRVLLGHNEDSGGRVMHQEFWCPGGPHAAGEKLEAEAGRACIPQVPETLGTYWSNMLMMPPGSSFDQGLANEAGVVMCSNSGGTSFDGELSDEETGLKEGGIGFLLRRAVMERARTAREAVRIAASLIDEWGYWSPARNYSFADRDEAWLMNVVKGRHYVAKRVPDDEVVLISNYLAIRSVDLADTENVIASPDLIEYAIAKGRYTPARPGDYSDFDFCAAYQPETNRTDPNKSIRMRTGWEFLTGVVYPDLLHYPERLRLPRKVSPDDVKALLRLSAAETYRSRGDGRADAFHVSGEDISRSNCRESWVAELGDKPLLNTLWRASANQDASPYVPWFPLAGATPAGYQWTSLEEARRVHFHMEPGYLDFDWAKSYFLYATLGELVNFDRGLMSGIWREREAIEAKFREETEAVRARAALLPESEAKALLGRFTCEAAADADNLCRELLAGLDTVEAVVWPGELSVTDESAEAEVVITSLPEFDIEEVDPASILWSLGCTGAKASVLEPAKPLSVTVRDGALVCRFRAHDVARHGIPGCLTDTYIRGYIAHRRFVAMATVRFKA
ncbi:C69 family dipeptidase [Sutterella sp.]|uniref:C69 family dipeptidase n=1 Tax=Sutterella sp. TaxID=1981025 RepID=UPI0026E0458E|nr:C69 family dipeptidase [Sutterella sp.]MDO5532690.1 C69 family dipeptidase [Sutterella sp.]